MLLRRSRRLSNHRSTDVSIELPISLSPGLHHVWIAVQRDVMAICYHDSLPADLRDGGQEQLAMRHDGATTSENRSAAAKDSSGACVLTMSYKMVR